MIILICIATFISTLLGGFFTFRIKSRLYLLIGFSAGAVIGVAFFDLLPTAMTLSTQHYGIKAVTAIAGLGFVFYMVLDRMVTILNIKKTTNGKTGILRGKIAASCLVLHSIFDGVTIGLAFQISTAIGGIVAFAVVLHDFCDGINTANVILKENGSKGLAIKWLILDAIAPIIGAASTLYYKLPIEQLGMLLALFSGFFLYIGASDFVPDSLQRHSKFLTTIMTVVGAITMYIVIKISGSAT